MLHIDHENRKRHKPPCLIRPSKFEITKAINERVIQLTVDQMLPRVSVSYPTSGRINETDIAIQELKSHKLYAETERDGIIYSIDQTYSTFGL